MDLKLLNVAVQDYINANIGISISTLALKKNPFPDVEWVSVLQQVEAKTRAKEKLPTWFNTKDILYPSKISVEQTSSERTANYKSTLVSGNSLIDLTGGFGVDDYYFAKKVEHVAHCEINQALSAIVKHNFDQLKTQNISCYLGDSSETLVRLHQKWDWIYIDPSRRSDAKGKVFLLKDCLPNVPVNLENYFKYANSILIKTAPLLDLKAGLSELQNVQTIHVIALENEVKELLWELHKGYMGNTNIKTVNLVKEETEKFEFVLNENKEVASYSLPQSYLYEPNSAIMKSGGFDEVSTVYKINKLHKHSHLYTTDVLINFPGRKFKINQVFNYNKTEMKSFLSGKQANITTRNFPDTVESIRKKWKIKDGGNSYCFFTTDENNNKIVLICTKI
ncbi:class I SAM-dependent methyltransferase [Flavobacterium sp. F-380]|uniref:Class I SAM-dependent methyltransferase n=1 Tax=Flavobacterium kayseriense TaxID=2764714 RepID=A0ABR7JAL7_9FLAO|nr:class I SAM-dependent methyltransferase [Flavobacterium kayseriense]MBC5842540.1 class I SAM-dependent methyltransferase [Flavobacterium kayseriense]MBC5849070.1 class I SAM-dependent methyltransferase [Flavobacterium kayseriense]